MLTRVSAPSAVVSTDEVKRQINISHNRDDLIISEMIGAATEYLDGTVGVLGQFLGSQQWRLTVDCFSVPMRLPIGPLITVDSVKYLDADMVEQTVSPGDYYTHADDLGPYIRLLPGKAWPSVFARDDAVRVTFTGGSATIPAPIRSAIYMITAHLYAHRELSDTERTFPTGFDLHDLIAPYRRVF
jgi:uncharacterized phiE125 gp8 family phage protein